MTICEVHVEEGRFNVTDINKCTEFCSAYGLRCISAFEDEGKCVKDMDTPIECDEEFIDEIICSCGKIDTHYS